jgi:hypothetical protein
MCVKEYSDLFLNLMIEYEPILAFVPSRELSHMTGKKLVIVPVWGKSLRKYPYGGVKLA